MGLATKELQSLQEVLDNQKSMTAEAEELRERNAALEEEIKALRADSKELEQFRPLLQTIPVQYYKIQLHDTPLMRQFIGQMTKVYGPRFGKAIENMNDKDAGDTKFARQCLDSATLACIRYCTTQNSRWNDMVAHHLS